MKIDKLTKRLKAIDQAIQVMESIKAAHSPFVLFQPWDMMNDQYNVSFYPEGNYQKPLKYEKVSYVEAVKILASHSGDFRCKLSMGACTEWLFALSFNEGIQDYTEEQIERLTAEYIQRHPQLEVLLYTDDGKQMLKTLARLPQTATIRLSDLQNALSNIKEEV